MTEVVLSIEHQGVFFFPVIVGEMTVTWERSGMPGRLDFQLIKDSGLDFQEGDVVRLSVAGHSFFYGYVFTKLRDKKQIIAVTCYDQLRYFKNKGNRRYVNLPAGQFIASLARDYGLCCGTIADTQIPLTRRESLTTFFDMIAWALDETALLSGERFILYDDFGKLVLQNVQQMELDFLVCAETAENFRYESSIDKGVYNCVRVFYEHGQQKILEEVAEQDAEHIQQWGLLELTERSPWASGLKEQAQGLLQRYNRKRRRLHISGVPGDVRVRAGCVLPVILPLGDVDAQGFFMVEWVQHHFSAGLHRMEMTLVGGDFTA